MTGTGPLISRGGNQDQQAKMIWLRDPSFQGWVCSQCEWNCALPALLVDPEAKTAYDRLAAGKFRAHQCADHPGHPRSAEPGSFPARLAKLVAQRFKPKDAVELLLQEVMLEYNNDSKVLDQARSDGEDFLRHVREGLV